MSDRSPARFGLQSRRITTATTTAVKASGGTVHKVIIECSLSGEVTFNDATGTKLILLTTEYFNVGALDLNMAFRGKIEVVTSAADKLVVVYE